jgi:hypothetical protein
VAFAFTAAACTGDPEVVALGSTLAADAGSGVITRPGGCTAGIYQGSFHTVDDPNAALNVKLDGDFKFELHAMPNKEFLEIDNTSPLSGETATLAFEGTVTGGHECVEGQFETTIVDAKFGLPGQLDNGVPFHGTVTGNYSEAGKPPVAGFTGTWETFLDSNGAALAGGTWSAARTGISH